MNHRRTFLKKLLVTGAAPIAFPSIASNVLFAATRHRTNKETDYRIGTCDWTLKTPLTTDSFYLAKQLGLTGLQYSFSHEGEGLDLRSKENRDIIRQTVKDTEVELSSLGMAVLNKVPFATSEQGQQIVIDCIQTMATLKKEADQLEDQTLAAKVTPNIVLMGFFGKADINGHPELIENVIEKLKRVAPLAEEHNIILGIESLLDEADHRHIMDSVGSPAVKVYYDVANSHKMGYDIYKEIESLGSENICQIHLKEDRALLGDGTIDFDRVKLILGKINYHNWLIIEGSKGSKTQALTIEKAYQHNAKFVQSVFNG